MKIYRWLHDSMSAVIGLAIVEVEPGEVADYDAMVRLVDVGLNFGTSVRLKSVNDPPAIQRDRHGSWKANGKLPNVSTQTIHEHRRFYEVHVSRD